jgi:TetR/AcrR family transcriptional regulator, cholesterol catabolism regulator
MVRHSTRPASAPEREIPDPAALPEDQRARRQRIIDAARQLMMTVSYGKIQVKDVAEEAGVSLGTLYRYFSSKDHLFACALADWAAPIEAALAERRQRSRGALATRVRTVYHASARAFEDAPRVYGALMALAVSADPYAIAEFQAFSRRELDMFASTVADVPEPYRDDIVAVLSSVLSESLRGYVVGMYPMSGVYQRLDQAIRLVFREPFEGASDA